MKKKLSVMISVLLAALLAGGVFAAAAAPAYRQTHVVEDYRKQNVSAAWKYYDGCARALDGSGGMPDLCIPGLDEAADMVPQGIAYFAAKNQMLISAYSKRDAGSVVFALDMTDGHLAAEYHIIRRSGSPANGHFGGIAVSANNLYFAEYASTISYVPLRLLNAADGEAADVTLAGTVDLAAYLNAANTSFVSCGGGMLWTGNYYDGDDEGYARKAADDCNTLLICYQLDESSSESEWASLQGEENACAAPTYTLRVPDAVENVQGAYLLGETAYLNTSYGRNRNGILYTARVDYDGGCLLADGLRTTDALPSVEDVEIVDGTMYTLAENGAWHFRGGDGGSVASHPFDTVWKVDLDALAKAQANPLIRFVQRLIRFFCLLLENLKSLF
ncbi:MAG: hypothetical protein IJK89_00800 [Clostridia bacterium]|nr:hypothetical protein [Clostridia bacterium]